VTTNKQFFELDFPGKIIQASNSFYSGLDPSQLKNISVQIKF